MRTKVVHGSALDVLRKLPDNSVHAFVTDPPYGLSNTGTKHVTEALVQWTTGNREFVPDVRGGGFMGKDWDSFVPPPAVWDEVLRVLKPGGYLLCFSGTRTIGLMEMSIRLAGFDIRDSIAWMYGTGFPKGQDVGKLIAKSGGSAEDVQAWNGWNTVLKPGFEPILMAQKPFKGAASKNVLTNGVGALNIDDSRIAHRNEADLLESTTKNQHADFGTTPGGNKVYGDFSMVESKNYEASAGRYPTNVILSHNDDCVEVGTAEVKTNGHHPASRGAGNISTEGHSGQDDLVERHSGTESVPVWECTPGCPVAELDSQSGITKSTGGSGDKSGKTGQTTYGIYSGEDVGQNAGGLGDIGGASRFFYVAKAPAKERVVVDGVAHPTVKPLSLMRYLVKLVTPPGGLVVDPFAGSGTTVEAALLEGFDVVGIELEETYIPLINARIERSSK